MSAPHGAKDSTGQLKTGQLGQNIKFRRINRHITASGDDIRRLPVNMSRFHQQGQGLIAAVQSPFYDFWTFGDKDSVFRVFPVQQLVFRQPGVDIQFRRGKVSDFDNICHNKFLTAWFVIHFT